MIAQGGICVTPCVDGVCGAFKAGDWTSSTNLPGTIDPATLPAIPGMPTGTVTFPGDGTVPLPGTQPSVPPASPQPASLLVPLLGIAAVAGVAYLLLSD